MDVVLVRWPLEDARRRALQDADAPRLLLVEQGVAPPIVVDCVEDWVRLPASEDDIKARVETLRQRCAAHAASGPDIDAYGVVRHNGGWVSLPPVEARLASAFVERFTAVVSREALARAGWPDSAPGRNALDVHVLRLRRRLAPVGLSIRTVRARGYLLEPSTAEVQAAQS
jgi:DNA-binding response OmpR family regulator